MTGAFILVSQEATGGEDKTSRKRNESSPPHRDQETLGGTRTCLAARGVDVDPIINSPMTSHNQVRDQSGGCESGTKGAARGSSQMGLSWALKNDVFGLDALLIQCINKEKDQESTIPLYPPGFGPDIEELMDSAYSKHGQEFDHQRSIVEACTSPTRRVSFCGLAIDAAVEAQTSDVAQMFESNGEEDDQERHPKVMVTRSSLKKNKDMSPVKKNMSKKLIEEVADLVWKEPNLIGSVEEVSLGGIEGVEIKLGEVGRDSDKVCCDGEKLREVDIRRCAIEVDEDDDLLAGIMAENNRRERMKVQKKERAAARRLKKKQERVQPRQTESTAESDSAGVMDEIDVIPKDPDEYAKEAWSLGKQLGLTSSKENQVLKYIAKLHETRTSVAMPKREALGGYHSANGRSHAQGQRKQKTKKASQVRCSPKMRKHKSSKPRRNIIPKRRPLDSSSESIVF